MTNPKHGELLSFTSRGPQVLLNGRPVGDTPSGLLTSMPEKQFLYATDLYFEEAWEEMVDFWPDELTRGHALHDASFLLLKPDAIARDRASVATEWLARNDYQVIWRRRMRIDRNTARALWWYQWNFASRGRRELSEFIMSLDQSEMIVVVRNRTSAVSASAELSTRKGSSHPANLRETDLRWALGAVDYLSNSVHVPDESADLVRELAILLRADVRRDVLSRLTTPGRPVAVVQHMATDGKTGPSWGITKHRAESLRTRLGDQVLDDLVTQPTGTSPSITELAKDIARTAQAAGIDWNDWDSALLLTQRFTADRPARTRLLSGPTSRT